MPSNFDATLANKLVAKNEKENHRILALNYTSILVSVFDHMKFARVYPEEQGKENRKKIERKHV